MKRILLAASALSLIAAPAFAQTAEGEVVLSGTVDKACGVDNHKSGSVESAGWPTADITGIQIADATTGQFVANPAWTQRSIGNVWCNTTAGIVIEVGSFATGTRGVEPADGSSFTNQFHLLVTTGLGVYTHPSGPYTGLLGLDPLVLRTDTGGDGTVTGPGVASISGTTNGAFETGLQQYSAFNVEILDNASKRPISGSYSGYVRFTATAS